MPSKECLEFLYENLTLEKIHFLTFYNIWGWLGIQKIGKRNTIELFYGQLLSYWRILLNYLIHSSSFSIPCLGFVKIIISFASGQLVSSFQKWTTGLLLKFPNHSRWSDAHAVCLTHSLVPTLHISFLILLSRTCVEQRGIFVVSRPHQKYFQSYIIKYIFCWRIFKISLIRLRVIILLIY